MVTAADWRLLVTEATDGATNMAIDEALWLSRQSGDGPSIRCVCASPVTPNSTRIRAVLAVARSAP